MTQSSRHSIPVVWRYGKEFEEFVGLCLVEVKSRGYLLCDEAPESLTFLSFVLVRRACRLPALPAIVSESSKHLLLGSNNPAQVNKYTEPISGLGALFLLEADAVYL